MDPKPDPTVSPSTASFEDGAARRSRAIVDELRTHQLELQAQNEELRRVQAELAESRDRYRALYDQAPVGYLTLSAEGRILDVNRLGAELLQRPSLGLAGAPLSRFLSAEDADRWTLLLRRSLQGEPVAAIEVGLGAAVPGADPLPVLLGVHAGALPRHHDAVQVTMTDLRELRRLEHERTRLDAQVLELQKMESIGTLAGGIAHDFNNILGAILGHLTLALQDAGMGPGARHSLEQIRRSSLRARDLVRQILAFSHHQAPTLDLQPLRPVVEEAVALLRATLPSGVALELTLGDAALHARVQATQIQQVLLNLCTNAWHALQGRAGHIGVGLEAVRLDADAARRLGLDAAGRYAHLWVRDDGCGMDAAALARIFDAFYTTKPVGEGTGLGLTIVQRIVFAHGGVIHVDSQPGQGSRFDVHLPTAEPGQAPAPRPSSAAEPAATGGQHLLCVDDDEVMLAVAQALLERAGYRVTACADPRAALAAVQAAPDAFDLVVTDHNMPGLSGVDLVRALAALRPDLPVLVSSGFVPDALNSAAQSAGAREVMHKEDAFEQLVPLVRRALSPRG